MSLRSLSFAALAVALIAGAGCSDHKTAPPGKACILNSDCNNPLSCSFGKCHEACRADGDCPGGELCVWTGPAPADGVPTAESMRVCLLDPGCAQDSSCPAPLVCGRDLNCRNECEADRDCPNKTYRCVVGGPNGEKVCAEPEAVGSNGELKPAADAGVSGSGGTGGGSGTGGGAGTGGAAGTGGSVGGGAGTSSGAGTGGTAGGGGAGGTAGAAGRGGAGSGGAAGAGGAAGTGGASGAGGVAGTSGGGGGGGAGGSGGLTVVPEMEPNNDRDTATPYTPGTQVMAMSMAGDYDYFALTTPPGDLAGGYYQLRVTNVGAGVVHVAVYSQTDNGRIGLTDGASSGESSFFYWAARPGQTYHVRADGVTGSTPFPYTFSVSYTKIEDPYEPNDDRESPKPIALGQTVSAYFFSGFASSAPTTDEDWYSIDLAAGPATATLTSVATNERLQIDLVNSDFERSKLGNSLSMGSNVNAAFTVPAAGKYSIVVTPFSFVASVQQGSALTVPDSFTRPYKLLVTQP